MIQNVTDTQGKLNKIDPKNVAEGPQTRNNPEGRKAPKDVDPETSQKEGGYIMTSIQKQPDGREVPNDVNPLTTQTEGRH